MSTEIIIRDDVQAACDTLDRFIDQTLAVPSPQAGYSVLSARNYSGAARQLVQFMRDTQSPLPDKVTLERWRDAMLADGKSVHTVNAKLAAGRKLVRAMIDSSNDLEWIIRAERWVKVTDAKSVKIADEDKIESDFGRRLTLDSARNLITSIDTSNLKGLRDRALIAVMMGAGLRVSEVANLTMNDMFNTVNEGGQRGIKIVRGKHNKTRVVVLNGWNSWVIKAVQAYTDAIGLSLIENPSERVFRGVKVARRGTVGKSTRQATAYDSAGNRITTHSIQDAVATYAADYNGQRVTITCHDLRRTYAKISKTMGMSWEALRANMGHSSVMITENYVGKDVDWSERIPNWEIAIK